jgi:hypothetical protein
MLEEKMTTDKIFRELDIAGWLVNSLYQIDRYTWRASLRNHNYCYEIAEGDTPKAALEKALEKTKENGYDPHDKRFPFGPRLLSLDDIGL